MKVSDMLNHQKLLKVALVGFLFLIISGCATTMKPIPTVNHVDIPKFMGRWYVIAVIPTIIETEAYNATETYALNEDGSIATTFTYHKGAFDGPLKTYHPKGFVKVGSGNAEWGMQFIWPIKAEYLITYLDDDYKKTIISRNARDYVWIMARTPEISNTEYLALTELVAKQGYDINKLRKVPQKWDVQTSPLIK